MINLQYWGARLDAERSVGAIIIQARDTEGSDQRVDRVLEKGRSREEASFFGLSHRKGGAAIPGLGKASRKVNLVEENQDFNFQHTETEISQRPPNGDEEMPHRSWRFKSGVWERCLGWK